MSDRMDPVFSNTDKAGAALGCSGCLMLIVSIARGGLGCLTLIIGLAICGAIIGTLAGG